MTDVTGLSDAALDRLLLAASQERRDRGYRRWLKARPYSPFAEQCRSEGLPIPTPEELARWDAKT